LGTVAEPGFALSCALGAVDVRARGSDIWGVADSGQFVSQQKTGDFDVRVQVQSFLAPSPDANAGLGARASIEPGSRNVGIVVYANQRNWTAVQRAALDGPSSVLAGDWRINWPDGAGYSNIWVRLKRAGNTFTTYGSTNGLDWTQIGQSVTPEPAYGETLLVGLRTTPVEVEVAGSTASAQYRNYGDYALTNATIQITQQPASVTISENKTATFSVVASVSGAPASNLGYQWQTNGVDIPNATASSYTTPLVRASDSGVKYRVKVSLPGGVTLLSGEATLTVSQDSAPPLILSTASLDGTLVGVCFNEPVDAASANDPSHYTLTGGAVVGAATLQADGISVGLAVSGLTGSNYTLTVTGVADLAGNVGAASAAGQILGLTAQDLGTVEAPGIALSCASGSVDVWSRGLDIWGFADSGNFVSEPRTGDFDVKVQVQNFTAPAPDSNAGLMVRENADAGSRNVSIVVYANQKNWTATQRAETDGISSVLAGDWRINWPGDTRYPNVWVRLKRTGNTFTTYGSTNGTSWTQIGQPVTPATAYPDAVLVGLRTTPVEVEVAGSTGFAQYRNYGAVGLTTIPRLEINRSGQTQIALSWPVTGADGFVLESKDALSTGNWQVVSATPTVVGDLKTLTLPLETSGNEFFRLRR